MKQVVQDYRTGELAVQDVPPPRLQSGRVLVKNVCSLISAGTERAMIGLARKNLLEKARSRPDLVRKVVDKVRTEGLAVAYRKAMERLERPVPLGYASAGIVLGVGEAVTDMSVGDAVACAGVGYACHAEVLSVPRNLCVRIPASGGADGASAGKRVPFDEAAYATLGAIALEAVRVAEVKIGEAVVVIGLGLVGLLLVQIVKAAGGGVVGLDPEGTRRSLALELGADAVASDGASAMHLVSSTLGVGGADAVLVAAATQSSEPVRTAGELARDRARVVIVGMVGLNVPHKLYYEKALDLRLSRSYGPGRYDPLYEEKGIDYPPGYVRWTENRNMQAFLRLVAGGKVNVWRLTTHRFPISQALEAYRLVTTGGEPYVGILLSYPQEAGSEGRVTVQVTRDGRASIRKAAKLPACLGLIGAGNFAAGVLLPALKGVAGVRLRAVCSQGGLNARAAAEKCGFEYCTSDAKQVLEDPEIDAVLIATRPASHAALASAALAAGKKVFVEKPLAVSSEQLREVTCAYRGDQLLFVGFNRRFSPFARRVKGFLGPKRGPLVALYRVSASALPGGDWQHDLEEGGGRIVGEAGHFVDLLSYLAGARPQFVYSRAVSGESGELFRPENVALTISFADGSLGTIVYVTQGSPRSPKERVEVFCDGATAVIDDFRRLELVRAGTRRTYRSWLAQDKGHRQELAAFVEAVRTNGVAPVPFEEYVLTTLCTLRAVESLRRSECLPVDGLPPAGRWEVEAG